MIFEGSRYEYNDVVRVVTENGVAKPTVLADPPEDASVTFTYYTVKTGDRIDVLADGFLGDPEVWWRIADANPQHLFWDYLPPGTLLRIPSARPVG